jgi:hypothetical protein
MPKVYDEAALTAFWGKRQRAWRRFMSRTHALAAKADPRTGGNEMLCRNWGTPESVDVWRRAWLRWSRYAASHDRRWRELVGVA